MTDSTPKNQPLSDLFPEASRILLTGTGRQFIERLGVEATREAVLNVMMGHNVRTQTEVLTRQRIALVSGAMLSLFTNGTLKIPNFQTQITELAVQQIANSRKNDKASVWPAQWIVGLTGKSVQNVLRSDPKLIENYVKEFNSSIEDSAEKCRSELGDLKMTLGFSEDAEGRRVKLNWRDILILTTAIGSQTLTLRGSDKAIFGKLFEKLILGSFLSILGFERVDPATNTKTRNVFWLSDSSDLRESDATLLLRPGKLARFDIGFIGAGNSEISKDKLSRYAREAEINGKTHNSVTFIVVDRLPQTGRTQQAAKNIEAEIIQMSMQYWVKDLAQRLGERLGFQHELQKMPDSKIEGYLKRKLDNIAIQEFVTGVSVDKLAETSLLPDTEDEIEGIE